MAAADQSSRMQARIECRQGFIDQRDDLLENGGFGVARKDEDVQIKINVLEQEKRGELGVDREMADERVSIPFWDFHVWQMQKDGNQPGEEAIRKEIEVVPPDEREHAEALAQHGNLAREELLGGDNGEQSGHQEEEGPVI